MNQNYFEIYIGKKKKLQKPFHSVEQEKSLSCRWQVILCGNVTLPLTADLARLVIPVEKQVLGSERTAIVSFSCL